MVSVTQHEPCPACGGAGGGPFGRLGSAWDVEGYVCKRCEGRGVVLEAEAPGSDVRIERPGIVKTTPAPEVRPATIVKKGA